MEATKIYVNEWGRVWEVGVNILNTLPDDTIKRRGVIGALIGDNSEEISKLFNLSTEKGCVVLKVLPGSIAKKAGLKTGDFIKTIDGNVPDDCKDIVFESGKTHIVSIERGALTLSCKVIPGEAPHVKMGLKQTGSINAYAGFSGIVFTLGLVHFVEDDNELAVIMGHELAHLISKHIPKSVGVAALCGILSGITGPFAPLTYKSIFAPYSRDNEREADYLGLLYAHRAGYDIEKGVGLWKRFALEMPKSRSKSFLRNHPASTERLLRVKKVVALLKSGN